MSEAPISIGKAYAVAASYYLESAARSKRHGDNEQAAYALELATKVSKWAEMEYGRGDTFTACDREGTEI